MITSTSNPQVKDLILLKKKARARRERQLYVVEGVRMSGEAPAGDVEAVYVSESFLRRPDSERLLSGIVGEGSGARCEVLSDAVFGHVSDTETPQGILCLMRMHPYSPEDVLRMPDGEKTRQSDGGLWLVLEGIQDPGNLGTMFRTGEGAGVTGIVMDGSTADLYNPKTIRSTMGSIWRVPFFVTDDLPGTLDEMKFLGIRRFAACGRGSLPYTEPDYTGPAAFLIGSEGNGLSAGALAAADVPVSIPMRGRLESLNAAMAAGLLLYEADRQRRARSGVYKE